MTVVASVTLLMLDERGKRLAKLHSVKNMWDEEVMADLEAFSNRLTRQSVRSTAVAFTVPQSSYFVLASAVYA